MPDRANPVRLARERGIPSVLASPKRGAPFHRNASGILPLFDVCLAASVAEAEQYRRHLSGTSTAIDVSGPLSDTGHALTCSDPQHAAMSAALAGRPVWFAASVTETEWPMMEAAHRVAFRAAHRLLLILAPREQRNIGTLRASLEEKGWQTSIRSEEGTPDDNIQVFIADTPDEAGLWYRVAPMSFLGGTLSGGVRPADPFEPAALGSAIVVGPRTETAPDRFRTLGQKGGLRTVADAAGLGEALTDLLAPDRAALLAQAAWATVTESAHVVERLAEEMDIALDRRDGA